MYAFDGQPSAAERWAAAVEATTTDDVLPDGSTLAGFKAWMRMLLCRDGVADLLAQAAIAREGLSPTSMARPVVLVLEAVAYFLEGDADRADTILAHAVDTANAAGASRGGRRRARGTGHHRDRARRLARRSRVRGRRHSRRSKRRASPSTRSAR